MTDGGALSPDLIANLLQTIGFKNDLKRGATNPCAVGTAIVLAESGGRNDARNVNTNGSIDRGLWQINNRAWPAIPDKCAYNPRCSTIMSFHIISRFGTDFSPWVTYKTGVYKRHLGVAMKACEAVRLGINLDDVKEELGDAVGNVLSPIQAVAKFLGALTQAATWIRVGLVLGGAILIFIALRMLAGLSAVPSIPSPIRSVA